MIHSIRLRPRHRRNRVAGQREQRCTLRPRSLCHQDGGAASHAGETRQRIHDDIVGLIMPPPSPARES